MQAKIYHNPRCSKSRQTLQVLLDHHVQPQIVKYLETPPTPEELKKLLEMMKLSPGEIIRFKDKNTRELGLSPKDTRSVEEWIDFMVKNPAIIERPIVVINGKAVLGRPPEKVLEIL
ncbi:MAG: arsenate reductase (glutaredoxin) [Deferribacteres bacterium]|nr:arsenate reductase (glutaredoxin) [candidate division KSB1 bacterium]MCB9500333.1 arsenate reductase (glutaredoxin) [Deferribacteres bacterium]